MAGCSKTETPTVPHVNGGDGNQTTMKGYAAFGSQCVSGFNTDPKAVKLELWSCPINLPVVELSEPLQPLYLAADCKRKVLTIRSQDRSINVNWELMPDGSFNITQDGLNAKLRNDGYGNIDCVTPLSMDLWGQVDCAAASTDQAKIHFETVMWLNKEPAPSPSAPPATTAPPALGSHSQCSLPSSKCYFHAISTVSQCN